jgi:UDP-N-acetylmuramoylalanine--D-glutamate ligase
LSKRIVILGAGESGTGCAVLAKKHQFDVFVSDKSTIGETYKNELISLSVDFEENQHTEALILNADIIIKSPGIPDKVEIIQKAITKQIPIISEIEFAYQYTQAKHIAITGTNGKTTTTLLCYHLLQKAGFNVGLGGNIGKSYARQVALSNFDYYVLEISSFQLDNTYHFKPNISILTNITPDHLDRYNYQFENYVASKFRICMNQDENDTFIYCEDDKVVTEHLKNHKIEANKISFSYEKVLENGAYVKDKTAYFLNPKNPSNQFNMFINDFAIKGIHNTYNNMAAAIAANVLNINKETIRESLLDFQNVEHRLEHIANIAGVEYINDSKATNVNSAWYALESMDKPVIWIAGGVDKGNDYESIVPLVKDKVKMIICLGLDNSKIHSAFGKHVDLMINTSSAEEAALVAKTFAKKGDAVLLSPACASFDLFANYEDRGNQFKQAVRNL